jgi:8-oxo-dGTP pyrophosphatase MutT (NUDIX family)
MNTGKCKIEKVRDLLADYKPKPLGIYKFYAVLLPLICIDGAVHILFEERSETVSQPGETSFPGGRVEPGETYEEAAVRETMEELQIARENIRVYGEIDFLVNYSNNVIYAFVGEIVGVRFEDIRPNEEVAEIYTMPVEYFIENKPEYYYSTMKLENPPDFPFELLPQGKKYPFKMGIHPVPFYRLDHHLLWGLTARMTNRFVDIIEGRPR